MTTKSLHPYRSDVSLALLAGGLSSRMGEDKAFATFQDGTMIEWMRDRTALIFPHVFAVARDPSRFHGLGIPAVNDALPEIGSAVGVYTAVLASPTQRVLCLACDMPFVTPGLLRELADKSEGFDVFVPKHGAFMQPLCAVYSKNTLDAYLEFIRGGGRRIFDIYPDLNSGFLDVGDGRFGDPDKLFLNVNTPEELEAARRAVAAGGAEGWRAALQPRIQDFMNASPLPVVSFIGKKKSGKTTVVLGVIQELRRRGWRLAVIKHDTHGFDVDVPGTDSYRFREVGAEVVGISSPEKYVWIAGTDNEPPLAELIRQIREPVDLVITEGFKRQDAPKIEVSRSARSTELVSTPDELIGITSDQAFPDYPVPQLALDDFTGLADLIERCILAGV
ncbi:MAG: molybdopterin-guanine dinucleotide biosynthesis protein B [Actinobacteria bacterium]|nr:molybdopterin-guanine dinucleotide biosynthesis protein B [Actinomycetota bacterium]